MGGDKRPQCEEERFLDDENKMTPEREARVLDQVADQARRGLLSPNIARFYLLPPKCYRFSSPFLLPEYNMVAFALMDSFAVALVAKCAPRLSLPVVLKGSLDSEEGRLVFVTYASYQEESHERPINISKKELRTLGEAFWKIAESTGLAMKSLRWDKKGLHWIFTIEYPGRMVKQEVEGLGMPDEKGMPVWPRTELLVGQVDDDLKRKAVGVLMFAGADLEPHTLHRKRHPVEGS